TFRVLGLGPALSVISEWRPQDFSHIAGFEIVLLAGLGLALIAGFRLPPVRILILLGLLHFALSAERNGELLALIAPLILAGPLARQHPALRGESAAAKPGRPTPVLFGIATLALAVLVTSAVVATKTFAPNPRVTPEAAAGALRLNKATRILNDYD